MEIVVTGRKGIEAGIQVATPFVIISIRDPGTQRPRIPSNSQCLGVLSLVFHDTIPEDWRGLKDIPPDVRLIKVRHANRVLAFVDKYPMAQTIVVHCEMGMSRSPAVAAALCEYLAADPEPFFERYTPNSYVYRIMQKAIREWTHQRNI